MRIFTIALAALATLFSCTHVETGDLSHEVELGLGITQTRTQFGQLTDGVYPVLWEKGDRILVNGSSEAAVTDRYAGKSEARFVVADVSAPYSIIYPSQAVDEQGNVTLAQEQTFRADSYPAASALLVGYGNTTLLAMKNLCAFVKVQFSFVVDAVTIQSNASEPLSGTFAVDFQNGAMTSLAGGARVRITGIPAQAGTTVIFAIPGGEYSEGFTVLAHTPDGKTYSKSAYSTMGKSIPGGHMLVMPELSASDCTLLTVNEITTAQQLKSWLQSASTQGEQSVTVLASDIDMSGVSITSASSFRGLFDGQGHTIRNLKTPYPLFTLNQGKVRNLKFDSSCVFTMPVSGMFGAVAANNSGTVSGCESSARYALSGSTGGAIVQGGIVGLNSGSVVGCSVRGNITAEFKDLFHECMFGGVVGQNTGEVEKCLMYGDITFTFESGYDGKTKYHSAVGGVVGRTGTDGIGRVVTVKNCRNYGKHQFTMLSNGSYFAFGGVIGATPRIAKATYDCGDVEWLENHGDLKFEYKSGGSGAYPNFGGVAAYVEGGMNHCSNYGDIHLLNTTEGNPAWTGANCGGVAGYVKKSSFDCHNYGAVDVRGFFAGGTYGALSAGNNGLSVFGGVFGGAGPYSASSGEAFRNCTNNHPLSLEVKMVATGGPNSGMGGVIGYATGAVSDCHNYSEINFFTTVKTQILGGVVGYALSYVSGCTNNAPLNMNQGAAAVAENRAYVGGVVGCAYYSSSNAGGCTGITSCENRGALYVCNGNSPQTVSFVGGIMGDYISCTPQFEDCINSGDIVVDSPCAIAVGGLCGALDGEMTRCENHASITLKRALSEAGKTYQTDYYSRVGGLVGSCLCSVHQCKSMGSIEVTDCAKNVVAGGIAGTVYGTRTFDSTVISAPILNTSSSNSAIVAGGDIYNANIITLGAVDAPLFIRASMAINGQNVTVEDISKPEKMIAVRIAGSKYNFVSVELEGSSMGEVGIGDLTLVQGEWQ